MDSTRNLKWISPVVILISIILLIHSTPALSSPDNRTAYEVLVDYNFPIGLLPKGVTVYDLDPATGAFTVYFNDTCSYVLQSFYHLRYKPTVKGYITNGKISSLDGIYVWGLFTWMEIVETVRKGDDLVFSVAIASAAMPINYFVESPQCGCGFQCGVGEEKKLGKRPFISPRAKA